MIIRKLICTLLFPVACFAQASANTYCHEYFDASSMPVQWTLSAGSPTAIAYVQGSGFQFTTNGQQGTAYAACAVGTQSFTFQADALITYNQNKGDAAMAVALTTSPISSMGSGDSAIVAQILGNSGPSLSIWSGNILSNYSTYSNALWGQVDASNYGQSFPYPQQAGGQNTMPQRRITVQFVRDGSNNLTANYFEDDYQNGLVPYYTYTAAIPAGHTSDSYQYISVFTLGGNSSVGYQSDGYISNVRVWAGISGGSTPTLTSIAPNAASSYQTGNTINLIGTNFSSGATCSVRVGYGSTYQSVTPTYVSSTSMTTTLPSESNGSTYGLHLICNGIDMEYYPGIYYSPPILYSISPSEVPPTPANSADGTIQLTGAGFDSTCTVTFAGNSGTVTYNSPTSLSVVVPNGSNGSPHIIVTCNSGSTTVYDSNSGGTYPPTGKISFGYSGHPYLMFNSSTLSTIQARWTNSAYADYVQSVNQMVGSQPTYYNVNYVDSVLFRYILGQNSTDLTAWNSWLSTANSQNPPQGTNMIAFFFSGFSAGLNNYCQPMAIYYDYLFPSLTPTARGQWEGFLQGCVNYYYYACRNDVNACQANNSWSNRIEEANASVGVVLLALFNSLQSYRGYATPASYVNSTAQTYLASVDTELLANTNKIWMSDGTEIEGSEYTGYGTSPLVVYIHSRINTFTLLGLTPTDPGYYSSNYAQGANFIYTTFATSSRFSTFNDSTPIDYPTLPMIDLGEHFGNSTLLAMADNLFYLEESYTPNWGLYQLNVYGHPDWALNDNIYYGAPYTMMLRTENPNPSAGVTLPAMTLGSASAWGAMRSQTATENPDFYLGIKGTAVNEYYTGHHHNDTCSFTLESQGEAFLGDPGYSLSGYYNHSTLTVDGNSVGNGTSYVSSFDLTNSVNTGAWTVAPMVCTSAYAAGVTAMRRTWVMYRNGTKRFAFVLDDINPSGAGAVVEYLQSAAAAGVSGVSSAGFTMKATASSAVATFSGPTTTISTGAMGPSLCSAGFPLYCDVYNPSFAPTATTGSSSSKTITVSSAGTIANGWTVLGTNIPTGTTVSSISGTSVTLSAFPTGTVSGIVAFYSTASNFTTAQVSYTASTANPMFTFLAPAALNGSGAMTASVTSGSGTKTVTLSDGASIVFANGSGSWIVSGTPYAPGNSGTVIGVGSYCGQGCYVH